MTNTFWVLGLLFLASLTELKAQTNISGIINAYAPVTAINVAKTILTIGTTAGTGTFATGDKVMVMQMKGATIETTDISTYGRILNMGSAGRYEWADVSAVSGSNITLVTALSHNFNVSGLVQLIRVPKYATGAVVTSTLTGLAWNGTVGGVLIVDVTGTLRLNGNISMDGLGYRGGAFSNGGGNCSITTYRSNNTELGYKGEGIAIEPNGNLNGRGALANGGGGGNGHNGGGGGGSNAGQGGTGGREWAGPLIGGWCGVQDGTCNNANNLVGGVGGYTLNPGGLPRYFMGGGGGGPQQDNNVSSNGTNGGGIIFIYATTIDANGANRTISANGIDAANAQWDGAGGGGAGGSILIQNANFLGNMSIQANGGRGGNTSGCHGPGGGGGGGYMQFTVNVYAFTNVTISAVAGSNGVQPAGTTCGSPAVDVGNNFCGTVSPLSAGAVVSSTNLPIGLLTLFGEQKEQQNIIWWQTFQETNNKHFIIERATNPATFLPVGKVEGNGNTNMIREYQFIDTAPLVGVNYYRLKQVDFDGTYSYSPIVAIKFVPTGMLDVFPNPAYYGEFTFQIKDLVSAQGAWYLYDLHGRQVKYASFETPTQKITTQDLPKGVYILKVRTDFQVWQQKIILQ